MTEKQKELVTDNLNLVHYTIQKKLNIQPSDSMYDELYSEGCLQLIIAAESYDETKGAFSTYACSRLYFKLMEYSMKYSIGCMAKKKDDKLEILKYGSLDEVIFENDNDSSICRLSDVIPDTSNEYIITEMKHDACSAYIKASPRYGKVIFDLAMTGLPERKIAEGIGHSRAMVSRIRKKARDIYNSYNEE